MTNNNTIKVTLTKSLIGRKRSHQGCAAGLGLSKINHSVTVSDTAANRGMIKKINYLVRWED